MLVFEIDSVFVEKSVLFLVCRLFEKNQNGKPKKKKRQQLNVCSPPLQQSEQPRKRKLFQVTTAQANAATNEDALDDDTRVAKRATRISQTTGGNAATTTTTTATTTATTATTATSATSSSPARRSNSKRDASAAVAVEAKLDTLRDRLSHFLYSPAGMSKHTRTHTHTQHWINTTFCIR
jgi:activator of HSP90 ATPase